MYNQTMEFKEDRRKELRSQGKSKGEANRIAWIEMAEQFSPLNLDIVEVIELAKHDFGSQGARAPNS